MPHPRIFFCFGCLAILFTAASCDRPEPRLSDEAVQRLRVEQPGITAQCLKRVRWGGPEAFPDRTDQCFEMMPRQQWRGVWRDDFEGSRFCPAPAETCSARSPGENIWLTFRNEASRPPYGGGSKEYAIDFIGRKTLRRGHYGHLGTSGYEVIVDRVIALRLVDER